MFGLGSVVSLVTALAISCFIISIKVNVPLSGGLEELMIGLKML